MALGIGKPFRLIAIDPSSAKVGWSVWLVDVDAGIVAAQGSGSSTDGPRAQPILDLLPTCRIAVIENQFMGINPATGIKIIESRIRLTVRAEDAGCDVVDVNNHTWHQMLIEPGERFTIPGKPARPAKPPKPGKRKGTPARAAVPEKETSRPPSEVLKARARLHALPFMGSSGGEDEADAVCIGHWAASLCLCRQVKAGAR